MDGRWLPRLVYSPVVCLEILIFAPSILFIYLLLIFLYFQLIIFIEIILRYEINYQHETIGFM